MSVFYSIVDFIFSIVDAKNIGLTNDDNIMNYFRAEYKKDPEGAYEYWLTNDKDRYNFG